MEREAVSLLWHVNQPGQQMWSALAKMQKRRGQNYTNHIRRVDYERFGKKNHSLFSSLKFPRLQEACFKMLDPAEEMHRLQYLVPSLHFLEINAHYGGHEMHKRHSCDNIYYPSGEFLAHIKVRTPSNVIYSSRFKLCLIKY